MHTDDLLTIGEVAARSGVAASALRYYESVGLISATRSAGGQRRYPRSVLRRVAFVRVAQQVGLSLDEIAAALHTLPDGRTPTRADWQRLARPWRARIDERIRELEVLKSELTSCIGCGCLSLRTCALYNRDDTAAAEGAGPRRLYDAVARAAGRPTPAAAASAAATSAPAAAAAARPASAAGSPAAAAAAVRPASAAGSPAAAASVPPASAAAAPPAGRLSRRAGAVR